MREMVSVDSKTKCSQMAGLHCIIHYYFTLVLFPGLARLSLNSTKFMPNSVLRSDEHARHRNETNFTSHPCLLHLQTTGHNWHVHENPPLDNTACVDAIGGHYNPFNVSLSKTTSSACVPADPIIAGPDVPT